jgi:hypothetical protein
MRGTILRALPAVLVAFAAGCFSLGGMFHTPVTPRGGTHNYWQKVGEILARKPAAPDMKGNLRLVREQTDALRELPTEGVDADLVAAVQDVVKAEEEVLERAGLAGDSEEALRQNKEMAKLFADANKRAAEAKRHLRALRDGLSAKYNGGFDPLPGPGGGSGASGGANRRGW